MAWIILVLAGLLEVGWAIGLKYSEGFSRLWPTVGTVVAMIASLWLLGIAAKTLPIGTAYSVWVGIGSVGTVVLGIARSTGRRSKRDAARQRGADHRRHRRAQAGDAQLATAAAGVCVLASVRLSYSGTAGPSYPRRFNASQCAHRVPDILGDRV